MSVVPLAARRLPDGAGAYGKSRDVPGTVNILYGHRLSQHDETRRNINFARAKQSHLSGDGKSMPAKQQQRRKEDARRISILPEDPKTKGFEINAKDEREYKSIVRTYDFEERTNKRILRQNIRCLVDEGMAAYEADIDARREKLRSMILAEEAALAREVIDQAQRGADWRTDEARRRAQELRRRLENERLATVTSKRLQQYLAQCPEARSRFAVKTTRETKYSNLVQIAENEAKRRAERELDGLWYGLMLRELEARKARDAEEEKRRASAGRSVAVTLEKQIAGKLALTEEEKRVKEEEEREYLRGLWESVKREELANHEREKMKRARLKSDLEEQLRVARRCLEERAREEAAVERAFRELGEAELARERSTMRESTSRLRNEIAAYVGSLAELREEEARREAEVEAVVEASAREVESRRDLARRKAREIRARDLRKLLEGREQQLRAKRLAHEEENRRAEVEGELSRRESEAEAALAAEAEARRRSNAARYGQELKAQQEYAKTMRRREREESERSLRADLEREEEYRKLAEQRLNAPEIITPHAFKMLLKECAARRDAEQKGLCYCPQSSAPRSPAPPGRP